MKMARLMDKFAVSFLLALAVCVNCHRRRDVPSDSAAEEAFKDVINKAETAIKEAGDHLSKMLGLEGSEQTGDKVVALIKTQTKAFTAQAEQVQKQLEDQLKDLSNSTLANAFSDISKKIQETVVSFREQIESSDVSDKAAALQAKFQEGINNLVEEGKKLANALEPQVNEAGKSLENLAKKVIDEAVDNMNQLQEKVFQAASRLQGLAADAIARAVDALLRLREELTRGESPKTAT